MKTLQVIHSVASGDTSPIVTPTYRVDRVVYPGFSRGLGEFMEKTISLVQGEYPWILIQPEDNEIDYDRAVEACRESPYRHFGFALSDDSYASHPHVYRNGQAEGWREIPYYDHGMFFAWDFYQVAAPYFCESKSFWGLEFICAKLHKDRYGTTCGLYCGAAMRHTKPIESSAWVIDGKTPASELAAIRAKYGV